MSIVGFGTCQNRGCYNDVEDSGNYCSEKCRRSDQKKIAHDKQILLREKQLVRKKLYPERTEAPKCKCPGCNNLTVWRNGLWTIYCSDRCAKKDNNFNYATG